jgi:hypothetical protein
MELKSCPSPTPRYAIHTKSARHVTPRYVMSRHTHHAIPARGRNRRGALPPTNPTRKPGCLLCVCVCYACCERCNRCNDREEKRKESEKERIGKERGKKVRKKSKEKNTKTKRHTVVQKMTQDTMIIKASRERKKGCPECKARGPFSRSKQIRDTKKNRSWRCCGGTEQDQRRQTFRRQDTQRQADWPRDGMDNKYNGRSCVVSTRDIMR